MKTIRKIISLLLVVLLFFSLLSVTAFAWTTDDGTVIVYVTRTGEKYHSSDCGYLRSKIEITLEEAVSRGYSRCSRCNAPVYTGETPVKPTVSSTQSHYSSSGSTISSKYTVQKQTTTDEEKSTSFWEVIIGIIIFVLLYPLWGSFLLFVINYVRDKKAKKEKRSNKKTS